MKNPSTATNNPITARTMFLKLGSIKPVEFSGASGSNLIWMDLPTVTEFAKGPNSPVWNIQKRTHSVVAQALDAECIYL